jgi:hypothetical protein
LRGFLRLARLFLRASGILLRALQLGVRRAQLAFQPLQFLLQRAHLPLDGLDARIGSLGGDLWGYGHGRASERSESDEQATMHALMVPAYDEGGMTQP